MHSLMEVYTDGSCIIGPDHERYGGAGVWFGEGDVRNTHVPIKTDLSTNQYAELLAIRYALILCRNVPSLTIYTDSKYSINCITVWYKAWEKNGWKTTNNKDVLHASLIKYCISVIEYRDRQGYSTSLNYVKGHSGDPGNDGADSLAGLASSKSYQRAMENTIFFSHGILSQFWPVKFVSKTDHTDSIEYNCVEQWYHHMKAITFSDFETAEKIMKESNPYEQKKLGRQVLNFDTEVWKEKSFLIAVQGNYHKFSQNPSLKKYLLSTNGKRLVEAREDSIWGIGITVEDAKRGVKWNGLNLLGKALMKVRDEMP